MLPSIIRCTCISKKMHACALAFNAIRRYQQKGHSRGIRRAFKKMLVRGPGACILDAQEACGMQMLKTFYRARRAVHGQPKRRKESPQKQQQLLCTAYDAPQRKYCPVVNSQEIISKYRYRYGRPGMHFWNIGVFYLLAHLGQQETPKWPLYAKNDPINKIFCPIKPYTFLIQTTFSLPFPLFEKHDMTY